MSKRHGHGAEEMPGQWRFEGEFYENKRNGFGKLVCTDGEIYEGEWKDDKKLGADFPPLPAAKSILSDCAETVRSLSAAKTVTVNALWTVSAMWG